MHHGAQGSWLLLACIYMEKRAPCSGNGNMSSKPLHRIDLILEGCSPQAAACMCVHACVPALQCASLGRLPFVLKQRLFVARFSLAASLVATNLFATLRMAVLAVLALLAVVQVRLFSYMGGNPSCRNVFIRGATPHAEMYS